MRPTLQNNLRQKTPDKPEANGDDTPNNDNTPKYRITFDDKRHNNKDIKSIVVSSKYRS